MQKNKDDIKLMEAYGHIPSRTSMTLVQKMAEVTGLKPRNQNEEEAVVFTINHTRLRDLLIDLQDQDPETFSKVAERLIMSSIKEPKGM